MWGSSPRAAWTAAVLTRRLGPARLLVRAGPSADTRSPKCARENRKLSVCSPPVLVTHTSTVKAGKTISHTRKSELGSFHKDVLFLLIHSFFLISQYCDPSLFILLRYLFLSSCLATEDRILGSQSCSQWFLHSKVTFSKTDLNFEVTLKMLKKLQKHELRLNLTLQCKIAEAGETAAVRVLPCTQESAGLLQVSVKPGDARMGSQWRLPTETLLWRHLTQGTGLPQAETWRATETNNLFNLVYGLL